MLLDVKRIGIAVVSVPGILPASAIVDSNSVSSCC